MFFKGGATMPDKKKPGVIVSIQEFLEKVGSQPFTHADIHAELVKKFPERSPDAMMSTIRTQVPGRLSKEKGYIFKPEGGGRFILGNPSQSFKTGKPYSKARYGKSMEYSIMGEMMREELDVFSPSVDDKGIDAMVRRPDGTTVEIQIKARSKEVAAEQAGLFAGIKCEPRPNYFFIFHAAQIGENGKMWIMSAYEFIENASKNIKGKNVGAYNLKLNGCKPNEETGLKEPYGLSRFEKFSCTSFERLLEGQGKYT
jgi:hypothetical protein